MKEERTIAIEGIPHTVVISDEYEALLAAHAAGRAVVGLWDRSRTDQDLSPAGYVVERLEDADGRFLEQVVRRKLGLPWKVGETRRLRIREFCPEDAAFVPAEVGDMPADRIFYTPEKLREYIRCQYGFYQYGIWALVRTSDGVLTGKAGVTNFAGNLRRTLSGGREELTEPEEGALELGYHIFEPYRGRGYAVEACREILNYVKEYLNFPVYAKIDASNEASIRVAAACGFCAIQKYTEAGRSWFLYVRSC